jgi:DNA processing protein
MDFPITKIPTRECSSKLIEIPNAPREMYVRGRLPTTDMKCLAVVGSRNYSDYGKHVIEHLISGLRGYPISIISGLAIGVDTLAHTTALEVGLHTVAIPGSGIQDNVIYPSRNKPLAGRILESGGALLSEFEPSMRAATWTFPQRNRIMAGMSDAVLLIEASEKSGTLITARLTADFNRELLVVPGSIFSENSKGVHQFLKLGATPVTSPEDIIDVFGLTPTDTASLFNTSHTDEELAVLAILTEPKDHDTILRLLPFPPQESLTLLMKMELNGHINENNGLYYKSF